MLLMKKNVYDAKIRVWAAELRDRGVPMAEALCNVLDARDTLHNRYSVKALTDSAAMLIGRLVMSGHFLVGP